VAIFQPISRKATGFFGGAGGGVRRAGAGAAATMAKPFNRTREAGGASDAKAGEAGKNDKIPAKSPIMRQPAEKRDRAGSKSLTASIPEKKHGRERNIEIKDRRRSPALIPNFAPFWAVSPRNPERGLGARKPKKRKGRER